MAYAINRNGTIQVYSSVPKSFKGSQKEYLGGFDQLTRAEQKAEGLFDVVMPSGYGYYGKAGKGFVRMRWLVCPPQRQKAFENQSICH